MLQRLYVQNYALIEEVDISFPAGLNILTGETGAGKSMLMGAIGLILGKRAEASALLFPDKKSVIEAVFLPEDPALIQSIEGMDDLDWESGELILRREISPAGKSRAFINDSPVNLNLLRAVASALVDLHGQHDGQQLLEPAFQLRLLDQYAGIQAQTEAFALLYRNWSKLAREIDAMIAQEAEAKRQSDFLRFQTEELNKANLSEEEEQRIDQELNLLEHAETIRETVGKNLFELFEDELSVYNRISNITRSLEKAGSLEERIAIEANRLNDLKYQMDDIASELQKIIDGIDTDPKTLTKLQERQSLYNKLKLKYGVKSVTELIALREQFAAQLLQFDTLEERIQESQALLQSYFQQVTEAGNLLSAARNTAAAELSQRIQQELPEVGLAKAAFQISLIAQRTCSATGFDEIRFMIRTNPGSPFGKLEDIASGGEISRVMLAIKAALAEKAALSVLIFDEIDTGISGEVALKVGKVMEKLAQNHQILTITHLPQIAGRGEHHFFIYKELKDGKTFSRIRKLSFDDRVQEIAVMMSGENPSAAALASARELLQS